MKTEEERVRDIAEWSSAQCTVLMIAVGAIIRRHPHSADLQHEIQTLVQAYLEDLKDGAFARSKPPEEAGRVVNHTNDALNSLLQMIAAIPPDH